MARVVAVGTGHAVARNGAEDDLGVEDAQVLVAHAAPGQRARAHGLNDDVGAGRQLLQNGDAGFGAQVEDQRALAPVEMEVHERGALHNGPRHFADVVAGRRLHLDHVRPQVDQRRGDGGRPQGRALNDSQSVQWRRCAIGPPVVKGRIVAADAQGTPSPAWPYWGDGNGGPRRRPGRLCRHRAQITDPVGLSNHGPMVAEALAHLGRADAIGGWVAGYRHPSRRGAAPGATPERRRSGPPPSATKTASPSGSPCSSARSPTGPSPPWWGSGCRDCSPAPSARPPTA